jgi:DNA-binding MarR family transcriptional regulator
MPDRQDLGALFTRVSRRLIEAERPLLAAQRLTMWGYIALSHLVHGPAPTQLALAAAIGHDKTRLIGVLDALEREGLVTREPDPADRRARIVHVTPAGRERHAAAVAGIRAMEDEFLHDLGAAERRTLLAALETLSRRPRGRPAAP